MDFTRSYVYLIGRLAKHVRHEPNCQQASGAKSTQMVKHLQHGGAEAATRPRARIVAQQRCQCCRNCGRRKKKARRGETSRIRVKIIAFSRQLHSQVRGTIALEGLRFLQILPGGDALALHYQFSHLSQAVEHTRHNKGERQPPAAAVHVLIKGRRLEPEMGTERYLQVVPGPT